ncbi:MAG TPA: acetoacetyl-CoA reductase [Alphaproteobacteria bacterium]|nr:acetoacetyl-CoA reductase [Alphaproteobacteria bacterium]
MKKEHVAVVTGGTRGIGAAISEILFQKGFKVISNYAGNDKVAHHFQEKTGIPVKKWDVSDYKACQKSFEEIVQEFGPVDVLINNAGITKDSFLHKMDPDHFSEVIQTNLVSCFNTTRCVIESMRERKFGRIINISSINGLKGQIGQTNYSAAKAGVIGFTKALALENASKGITVNAIAPGYIDTDMLKAMPEEVLQKIISQVPTGRLGKAKEVAKAVAFLSDEDASYITGVTLSLNGGQYLA